jgi:protein gp37
MNKTNIEWCDQTWNPVTGCKHSCPYCYAKKYAHRFSRKEDEEFIAGDIPITSTAVKKYYSLTTPIISRDSNGIERQQIYPYGFAPTFHRYRLEEPQLKNQPQNVFVCSMADLFGDWVPDEWVQEMIKACKKAPQHRYIFLTKNYRRYNELLEKEILPLDTNMYFGASVTNERQLKQACLFWDNIDFLSIEPLMDYMSADEWFVDGNLKAHWKWVIIGAETGNRKGKVIPEREWIKDIVDVSRKKNIPVFLKNSLAKIWGEPLIQEYPWEVRG